MASASASASASADTPPPPSVRRLARAHTAGAFHSEVFDNLIVPTSLASIAPVLRVANDFEAERPRVAYLCRFHAFEKAHMLDPHSTARGVRQFKTALLQCLEKENEPTTAARKKKTDAREMQDCYQKYYEDYVKALDVEEKFDRAELAKRYQTAAVLFEVLCAVNKDVDPEIMAAGRDLEVKKEKYIPYNILPLDEAGISQPVMNLPEIKAAVSALWNTRGLPVSDAFDRTKLDLLDWLEIQFGFQKHNVANQREHLVLLLASVHTRLVPEPKPMWKLDDRALDQVMKKIFKNYKNWCKFLGRKDSLWLPKIHQDENQRKILYIGLYLLIWGEAANIRFMPECLCYIFHNMALELHGMLAGNVSAKTGDVIVPAYGGENESFLRDVVMPIYNVVKEEADNNNNGTAPHSAWRNYDDLNEYFWTSKCFQLGWPMRRESDFFQVKQTTQIAHSSKSYVPKLLLGARKTNFVEVRTFWHLFRSFDRMWTFYILALQVMIILAWNSNDFYDVFQFSIFEKVLSIFITAAILRLIQVMLDLFINFKAYNSMKFSDVLRLSLKLLAAVAWVIILPVCYAHSWENPSGVLGTFNRWFRQTGKVPSVYITVVVIYLLPNLLGVLLFWLPPVRRWIENSNWQIFRFLLWWSQPQLYIGRGMHDSIFTLFKYTFFWVFLLMCKFSFNYFIQIKKLLTPTRNIMGIRGVQYEWHELLPRIKDNFGAVISIWAPVILVYFMDTQIWYSVCSTLFGGVAGTFRKLGEIRTLGMLRSRFLLFPGAFNTNLVATETSVSRGFSLKRHFEQVSSSDRKEVSKFSQVWNEIINSFREEDIISYREMDLLLVPYSSLQGFNFVQWPPFLLTNKLIIAIDMAAQFKGKDQDLWKRISGDEYMKVSVLECWAAFKYVLYELVVGKNETEIISSLIEEVEKKIDNKNLLENFRMSELPLLYKKIVDLIELLKNDDGSSRDSVILLFQDMLEVVTRDMMKEGYFLESKLNVNVRHDPSQNPSHISQRHKIFFASDSALNYPPSKTPAWIEQIKRLHLLLTVKESAMDVPVNLVARQRISFFTNSLFMDMPRAPSVQKMLSFSVLTPYYNEETLYSKNDIYVENEDGVSILFYLQKIYPDEWDNLMERLGCKRDGENWNDSELWRDDDNVLELRHWASRRGQTLSRTVRGMMYYRNALHIQAFFEMASEKEILEGYRSHAVSSLKKTDSENLLTERLEAVADVKYTYVVACQNYGLQKQLKDHRATDILNLMLNYPSLRVSYIDEVERREKDNFSKEYYSVLVKAVNGHDQEIYRIRLPGNPLIGEGKPENQNHSIIFTRGEALQTIDMNQDNYLEETYKMRNLLEEFCAQRGGHSPTILGVREHIFTGSVSSLAWFMSNQETTFVTIGQRVLANPLKVRFHYGHPDVFDRIFHITRGGISKASRVINLTGDIFAGFNSTLRRGNITHHEFIQVGKGRDVGLNQISMFEAKVATGHGEEALSRDMYRLGHRFDFFRMLSCYFTTVGSYFSTMIVVLTVYVFLYSRMYLALSGIEKFLSGEAELKRNVSLESALAAQSLVQLGLLMALPMVMEIGLERGFATALTDFLIMQLQMASVFFTFSLGTKTHYFCQTILHGGAMYRPLGHGFVVKHDKFAENYRMYSRSHFTRGLELMVLLLIYNIFGSSSNDFISYLLVSFSLWFLVGTWLFAPFLFNPSGFEWQKIVEDWDDWRKWIDNRGGIGVPATKSWESWWEDEQEFFKHTGFWGRLLEVLFASRFFLFQYGLVYHLHIVNGRKNFGVYWISWLVMLVILMLLKVLSMGRQKFSADFQLLFRLFKAFLFAAIICTLIPLFAVVGLTVGDLFICILAFLPTGWALLQIAQACKPIIVKIRLWELIKALARGYEYTMGFVVFAPVAVLAWFPFVSEFQTRLLFNQAFSRGLQISRILSGGRKQQS